MAPTIDGRSALARIDAAARLGSGVVIGDFTVVHDNVVLEDDVVVGSHCVIGHAAVNGPHPPLVVGRGSLIRSHSVLYEGSTFGPGMSTGHRVTLRERLTAGPGLQVGTLCDYMGYAEIGDYVRTLNNVHLSQHSRVGSYVWIFPFTCLTNDPHPPSDGHLVGATVEDFAVIATSCTLLPGVRVGTRSLVAAHTLVNKDVPPDTVWGGVPGRSLGSTDRIMLRDGSGPAYPWMRHFHRGYPPDVVARWVEEFGGRQGG